jgi:hypothetical protein
MNAMPSLMRRLIMVLAVLLLCLLAPQESTQASTKCKPVRADQRVTASTTSPTTTGVITNGGILNGTTSVTFTSGLTPTPDPTTFAYTAALTIATNKGTLTASDVGIFDTTRGVFTDIARISGGTGNFAGATGTLFITGTTADGVNFDDEITGTICQP